MIMVGEIRDLETAQIAVQAALTGHLVLSTVHTNSAAATITRLDADVGRLFDLLKRLRLDERTLVVFTSDNGPLYDELGGTDTDFFNSAGGLRGRKRSVYEGGHRVPGIIRWPGKIEPGTRSDLPVIGSDFFPTALKAAGLEPPAGRTLDGVVTSWNAGAEKMLGYAAAEIIGKSVTILIPPDRSSNLAANDQCVLQGNAVAHETNRLTKDGQVIPVIASHSPTRDGAGTVTGVSIILQDITKLRRTQAALEASEARFRATFEQAAVGIAHIDVQRVISSFAEFAEIIKHCPKNCSHDEESCALNDAEFNSGLSEKSRSRLDSLRRMLASAS